MMDARSFVTSVYRLAPPADRPGARIGSQVDAAYLAAIGEVVRAYGVVSAVELLGVEVTQVIPATAEPAAEFADVARLTDPDQVGEELDRDGEALATITVNLGVDAERVGVVVLTLRLEH
jgi:hypothetical protein